MKKLNCLLLMAAGLMMASCSNEKDVQPDLESGQVHITVNLPKEYLTRAIGDGYTATSLGVYVYDVDDSDPNNTTYTYVLTGNATFDPTSLSTNVDLDLVTNKSYKLVFFAYNNYASDVYEIDPETGELTVNYDQMVSYNNSNDFYDCFYNTYSTGKLSASHGVNANVTLYRPVAQINWGSVGLSETSIGSNYPQIFGSNGEYIQTTLSVNAYKNLNLLSGDYSNQADVTLGVFKAPNVESKDTELFPVAAEPPYTYVAMQYVLAPKSTSENYDLVLDITSSKDAAYTNQIVVSSAPVQANYQTNIYGSLLSSNARFTVTKDPIWGGQYNISSWDGATVTYPTQDENGNWVIKQASDLAGLSNMVNGTEEYQGNAKTFAGETVILDADVDMNENVFPTIGSVTRTGTNVQGEKFQGVFDGQGHTISNVTIEGTDNSVASSGFFANVNGGSAAVKDVTFINLVIKAPNNEQAGVVGILDGGATVSNVTVDNSSTITSKEAAGGVVGRMLSSGTISGCSNAATVSSTDWNAGGIVGAAYYTTNGETMTIEGCTNTGVISGNYAVGGIAGLSSANVKDCTNMVDITGNSSSVGGIVGEQKSAGSVTGCTNRGNITGGSSATNYGAGGIIGWVRYDASAGYSVQNVIVVSGNNNSGSVKAETGAGGIVGIWFQCGICYGNTNTAPELKANLFTSGIVGGSQWIAPETVKGDIETSYNGVTGDEDMLYVQNNYSTTTDMNGGCKANYVYVNSAANTSVFGNSQTNPAVVNATFNADNSVANTPAN